MNRTTKMKLLFCVPILVILICYFVLLSKSNDNTLYLEDMAGNRDFLKPFAVNMELYGNGFHENVVVKADGITREHIEKDENIGTDNAGIWRNGSVYVNDYPEFLPAKDAVVTEEKYTGEYNTTLTKYDKAQVDIEFWVNSELSKNMMHMKPDLVFMKEGRFVERVTQIDDNTRYYDTNLADFMRNFSTKSVVIGDNLYTVICTGNIAKGTTGIYRTNMQDLCNVKTSASTTQIASPFLEISVDEQNSILGLEAVGENLALFRREGTVVWLELYDTAGNLLQNQHWDTENDIDDCKIQKTVWQEGTGFRILTSQQKEEAVYEITKEILFWVEGNTIQQPQINIKSNGDINAIYKNYCLSVSTEYAMPEHWKPFYAQLNNPPLDYIFTVYDENGVVYQGKLVTDWKDDYHKYYGNFYTIENGRTIAEQNENHSIIQTPMYNIASVRLVYDVTIKGDLE